MVERNGRRLFVELCLFHTEGLCLLPFHKNVVLSPTEPDVPRPFCRSSTDIVGRRGVCKR